MFSRCRNCGAQIYQLPDHPEMYRGYCSVSCQQPHTALLFQREQIGKYLKRSAAALAAKEESHAD